MVCENLDCKLDQKRSYSRDIFILYQFLDELTQNDNREEASNIPSLSTLTNQTPRV